jgi:hypothetical protein
MMLSSGCRRRHRRMGDAIRDDWTFSTSTRRPCGRST